MRVVFLTNIVSPYRLPVFESLAQTPGWDFHVLVNAQREFDRGWDVDTSSVRVKASRTVSVPRKVKSYYPVPFEQVITLHLPVGLWGDLLRLKPDVVISHETGPRSAVAAAYCRMFRVPLVLWAYQSRVSATQAEGVRRFVRNQIFRSASAVVGMGTQTREVLRGWGVKDENIIDAPNAADHRGLQRRLANPETQTRVRDLKERYGRGRRIALVVGRLIPLKGTAELLGHWSQLPREVRRAWSLVFVGSGPLEHLVQNRQQDGIHHVASVQPEAMADWYRAADLHLFPTLGDVWGLVVNEAMACGTPTLCSVHAGCCDDLIRHRENGWAYDPTRADASESLCEALCHPLLESFGGVARKDVAPFTTQRLADAFREGVNRVTTQAVTSPASAVPSIA